jgi:hypothetical protein
LRLSGPLGHSACVRRRLERLAQASLGFRIKRSLNHFAAVLLVPLLYAFAIGLARGHRRRTLMSVVFAILIAGVLVLLGREAMTSQIPASLVKVASIRPAASTVVSIATVDAQ